MKATALKTVSRTPQARLPSSLSALLRHPVPAHPASPPAILSPRVQRLLTPRALHLLGVCLAYFESKFNPSAVYENTQGGYTGFGLFQIRNSDWCDHGKNLCAVSCSGGSFSLQPPGTGGCRGDGAGCWPGRCLKSSLGGGMLR